MTNHKRFLHLLALVPFSLFLCLSSGKLVAQTLCFESYPMEEVLSIEEDASYLWLGTRDSGLVRFDKQSLQLVRWNSGNSNLPENQVKSLLFYQQKLWLSTDSSLYIFENGNFILQQDTVEGLLLEAPNGDLVAVGNRDYHRFANGTLVEHKDLTEVDPDQCCSTNSDATFDASGNLWISHHDFYQFSIFQYDGIQWHLYNILTDSVLPIESFQTNGIIELGGEIYAANWGGMQVYGNSGWQEFQHFPGSTIIQGTDTFLLGLSVIEKDQNIGFWGPAVEWTGTGYFYKLVYWNKSNWEIFSDPDSVGYTSNALLASSFDLNYLYLGSTGGLTRIDKACLGVGMELERSAVEDFHIYPNPSFRHFTVRSRFSRMSQVKVVDAVGRVVFEDDKPEGLEMQIDAGEWNSGVYQVMMELDGSWIVKKLVIAR